MSKKNGIDYFSYLQSKKWKQKIAEAKARFKYQCVSCNRTANETILEGHHLTYERFGNELPEDIVILCRSCHRKVHSNKYKHEVNL